MIPMKFAAICMTVAAGLLWPNVGAAQEMSADYKAVLTALGKGGDFKDGVLKVNIPQDHHRAA